MAVKEENKGAKNTQTLRMSIVMWKKCKTWYSRADVIISPAEAEEKRYIGTWRTRC